MKTYKLNTNNTPFISKSSFNFNNFEMFSGVDLCRILEQNYNTVLNTTFDEWDVTGSTFGFPKANYTADYGVSMEVLTFQDRSNIPIYSDSTLPMQYSLTQRSSADTKYESITLSLNSEHYIRSFMTSDIFTYVNIPNKFLRDTLERIICNTDTQNFFSAIDTLESLTLHNLIDLYNKFDTVFTSKAKYFGKSEIKPPYYMKWRRDLFLPMVYSMSKLGYYNPVITKKHGSIFFDGSHRLGVGAALGFDYPILLPLSEKTKISDNTYVISTAGMFRNETSILFEIDIVSKQMRGWEYSGEQMKTEFVRANYQDDEVLVLKQPAKISEYYKEFIKRDPDYIFYE